MVRQWAPAPIRLSAPCRTGCSGASRTISVSPAGRCAANDPRSDLDRDPNAARRDRNDHLRPRRVGAAKGHLDGLAGRPARMERRPRGAAPRRGGDGARARARPTRVRLLVNGAGSRGLGARRRWAAPPNSCRRATATSGCATPGRFLRARTSGPVALRFATNSWGGKYDLPDDATVGDDIARLADTPVRRFDFVLEGGAVDHDGEGTDPDHAADAAQPQPQRLEQGAGRGRARRGLRRQEVIWIDEGLKNDHTDGHIDNIARFVGPGRVVCQAPAGDDDPNARNARRHRAHARSGDRRRGPQAGGGAHPRRRPLPQRARRGLRRPRT